MKRLIELLGLPLVAAFLLSGCIMLGPNYQYPTADVQDDWLEIPDPLVNTASPVTSEWWKTAFNDPTLDQLVESALAQNLSLRSAGLRVLQAQQQLAIAIGNQFPQQQQGAGAAVREKAEGNTFNNYSLGFNLSWEIDFWGRFRLQVESASAALDASVADYDGAMVSLIAGVAQNYLLVRTTQQRLNVAQNNVKIQRESVRITTAKFEGGVVSSLDVDQAQTLLYNTSASVASYEQSLQQFKNNLAILMGTPPHDMSDLLGGDHVIPTVSTEIALGMPQDIIRRRPDIRSAERQLAAQSAQIGFAKTELYPHFSIGGSIGTSATHSNDLFGNNYDTWDLFGGFRWNIFNYGRLKSNVRLQDALFQQLLEDYRGIVLRAQGEVENAIVAYIKSKQQFEAYQLAAAAAQRASDISLTQYHNGLVDFNTVITTLKSLLVQQDQLAAVHGTVTTNLVTVYKSLGGGWEIRKGRDPVDLLPTATKDEMKERTGYWEDVLQ
jgi:NodT family efflux transporter outer membrane factor (OMF) lipoprotein